MTTPRAAQQEELQRGSITIREVGPREGFQSEPGWIDTSAKASLVASLSETGLPVIQVASFASRSLVPQVADAEEMLQLIPPREGVRYTAVWFNVTGLERAQSCPSLAIDPIVAVSGSATFAMKNWHSSDQDLHGLNEPLLDRYEDLDAPITVNVAAAFGCNFEGRLREEGVMNTLTSIASRIRRHGLPIGEINLADTMAWANPKSVRSLVRTVRREFEDIPLALHLHDTRGLGLANALAGLEEGVDRFDSAVAGLGGCPFSGQRTAAGNIATEDLVLLCHEMGIVTGVDSGRLLDAGVVAEQIVGHPGTSRSLRAGHLRDEGVLHAGSR